MPPIDVDVDLSDIRIKEVGEIDPLTVHTPDLGNMGLRITQLPDLSIAVTELPELRLTIEKIPKIVLESDSTINMHIKEIPDIRAHLPANFKLGFSILGMEFFTIDLCGEAQMITEKYEPRGPEICK
jgi:hypothetical protein